MADNGQEIIVTNEAAPVRALVFTPMELLARALENGATADTLAKLMDLQERHEDRQARKAYDAAMAAAKAEMPTIAKTREVDFTSAKGRTNYKHEDLATIAETITPILGKHGLAYRFRTASPPNEPITVTCIVSHVMGYSEENTLQGPRDESGNKNSIQAIGSTLTYLQRMTLKAALGLAAAEKDDDGKAAGGDEAVSEDQLKELQALASKSKADLEKLCAYFKVESLPDLRASQFQNAKAALQAKVAQAAKKAGDAK